PDPDGQVGAAPHDVHDEQADPGGQRKGFEGAGPPYRYPLLLVPNGLGSSGPHTHNHRACQAAAPLTSGRIAILARDSATVVAANTRPRGPVRAQPWYSSRRCSG